MYHSNLFLIKNGGVIPLFLRIDYFELRFSIAELRTKRQK